MMLYQPRPKKNYWHPWFAWYPVRCVGDSTGRLRKDTWVWLEPVMRFEFGELVDHIRLKDWK